MGEHTVRETVLGLGACYTADRFGQRNVQGPGRSRCPWSTADRICFGTGSWTPGTTAGLSRDRTGHGTERPCTTIRTQTSFADAQYHTLLRRTQTPP
eukprot:scaffold4990_cov387-Prasinococcus_capsulatus_cf.AAC.2